MSNNSLENKICNSDVVKNIQHQLESNYTLPYLIQRETKQENDWKLQNNITSITPEVCKFRENWWKESPAARSAIWETERENAKKRSAGWEKIFFLLFLLVVGITSAVITTQLKK
jgi:hypothetical protein